MTVIACKNGVVVADRQVSFDDTSKNYGTNKLYTHKGLIISGIGKVSDHKILFEWFKSSGEEFPILSSYVSGLLVIHKYIGVIFYEDNRARLYGHETCAFGKGRDVAMKYMLAGASAEEAVKLTIDDHPDLFGFGTNKKVFNKGLDLRQ